MTGSAPHPLRVTYVFWTPRTEMAARVDAGRAPDTLLFGQNHLAAHGIDARQHRRPLWPGRSRPWAPGRLAGYVLGVNLPFVLDATDVVFTPVASLLPVAARLRRRPRVVLLATSLTTSFNRASAVQRQATKAVLGCVSAIVCLAESQRQRIAEVAGVPDHKLHLCPLGVDERYWAEAATGATGATGPPPGDYVLAVGRDPGRDYATLLEAVAGLDTRTVVVTSPANVAGLDPPANVEFRFDVSHDTLRGLYRHAACVVVPTHGEDRAAGHDCSGQVVLLETMAMGRPLVVTERSTLADYLTHDVEALTVPTGDPPALRAAIDRVLSDPALAARLGAGGRARVESDLTSHHFAARVAGVLRSVAPDLASPAASGR